MCSIGSAMLQQRTIPARSASEGRRFPCWRFGLVLMLLPAGARAAEPPLAGRPADFSGAVGVFRMRAGADPTTLAAEDPLLLTLRISAIGAVEAPPRRPDLRRLDGLFQIAAVAEKDARPDQRTWLFVYRLRPRTTQVKAVPRLKLVYFNPASNAYESTFTDPIPLTVRPRSAEAPMIDPVENGGVIDRRYPLVTGDAVLAVQTSDRLPRPWILVLLFLAPPAVCLAWYQAWRRQHPDAARLMGRRRSKAGREALKALRTSGPSRDPEAVGARVAGALARYLHHRLDLATAEPTPVEAQLALEQADVSAKLAEKAAELLRRCDVARFTPGLLAPDEDLAAEAVSLVRELEAEPCLSQPS